MRNAVKRSNNRNAALLDAAAALFANKGYKETTMRDIAQAVGILPGSIYYHYGSKDELLLAIYRAGMTQFIDEFEEEVFVHKTPAARLRAAMISHIKSATREDSYSRVITRVFPSQASKYSDELKHIRDRYEDLFRDLIDEVELPPSVDKTLLRLMIIGAGNYAQYWFTEGDRASADEIGQSFFNFIFGKDTMLND
ncbi:MAG: TetR/AcrR family transcriptional regulator [Pseudomonadota bacterium]